MATIPGTNISAYIVPFDTADTYATHNDKYGRGGYRVVNDLIERNNITDLRQKVGMLVYVLSEDKTYRLISTGLPPLTDANFLEVTTTASTGNFELFGSINCNTNDNVYEVIYSTPLSSVAKPIVTLEIPSENDSSFNVVVTNNTVNGFKIVLSGIPDVSGYIINWLSIK